MTRKTTLRSSRSRAFAAVLSAAGVLLASGLHASSLNWDADTLYNNGTLGGTGTWNTTNTNWDDGLATGGGGDVAWTTNTITGDTAVFGGTAGTVTLGGTINALGLQFGTTGYTIALGGNTLSLGSGGITSGVATATISGTGSLSLASNQAWDVVTSGTLTVSSAIGGSGSLTKTGSGILTLSNASNTQTGVTIQNGILRATSNAALGSGTSAIALGDATSISSDLSSTLRVNSTTTISRDVTVGANNTATAGTYTIDSDNLGSAWGVSGNITLNQSLRISSNSSGITILSGGITSGSTGTQTLTLNNTATAFASRMDVSGGIGGGSGMIAVTKTGAGYVRFTTANTYTGDTRIAAGILQIDANNAGVTTQLQNSTLDMMTGDTGTLEFRGSTGTVGAVFGGLKGSRNIALQNTSSNAVALTVGGNGQSTTYSGALSGSGSLGKSGAGTLTLSGANTYTGATTINAGTLALGASDRIANTSAMILNGGAFATGGFNETLGALTVSADSAINFGSGTSALVFADSSSISWTAMVTVLGFDIGTDTLRFGTSASALSLDQLSKINLAGYAASLDGSGFVNFSAIPEPSTYAGIAGLAALGGAALRRRRKV